MNKSYGPSTEEMMLLTNQIHQDWFKKALQWLLGNRHLIGQADFEHFENC